MNVGEFFGGLAILAVVGWLGAMTIAALVRGGVESAFAATDLVGSIMFGGGGLLLFLGLGIWLVFDAF